MREAEGRIHFQGLSLDPVSYYLTPWLSSEPLFPLILVAALLRQCMQLGCSFPLKSLLPRERLLLFSIDVEKDLCREQLDAHNADDAERVEAATRVARCTVAPAARQHCGRHPRRKLSAPAG
jgi:hypothetical protein